MQLTKRQRAILTAAADNYQAYFDADARDDWTEQGRDGEPPSAEEVDEVCRLVRELDVSDPDDGYKGPMKDGKPYVTDNESVVNALLLTDAGMKPGSPLDHDISVVEKAVAGWTDDQKAAAFEWAACAHLHAGDNDDVVVPPCPPHVEEIRPKYGAN